MFMAQRVRFRNYGTLLEQCGHVGMRGSSLRAETTKTRRKSRKTALKRKEFPRLESITTEVTPSQVTPQTLVSLAQTSRDEQALLPR